MFDMTGCLGGDPQIRAKEKPMRIDKKIEFISYIIISEITKFLSIPIPTA